MDITDFLNNGPIVKKDTTSILKSFSKYLAEGKLNLLEYTYLTQFTKAGGSLGNVSWLIDLIERINEKNLRKQCIETFNKFFNNCNDEKLQVDNVGIATKFIDDKKDIVAFTQDQQIAIRAILDFIINHNDKGIKLHGYAGTGKTTTVVELISYLLMKGYLHSVAFTAPTNKAVNIMKSKARIYVKTIAEEKLGTKLPADYNMDDALDRLLKIGIKIEFLTIHRLLNYKNDFDMEGDRIFIRGGESNITDYELVIIDECSMIPLQIIVHLIEDIYKNNSGDNYKRVPKVLFSGDPAQLPPVNEKVSCIFIKNKNMIKFSEYKKALMDGTSAMPNCFTDKQNSDDEELKARKEILSERIMSMKTIILKKVMRNSIQNVVNLCYNIRQWVEDEIKVPQIAKYKGKGVHVYKCDKEKKHTAWFLKCVEYIKDAQEQLNTSNIILTWTNRQMDYYNTEIRKILFKDIEHIKKFEIGDILMMKDFYTLNESSVKIGENSNRFYTSEQIKITELEQVLKKTGDFTENLGKKASAMKNVVHIHKKYITAIRSLNSKTKRQYCAWKLHVHRLSEVVIKNTIPEVYQIYVINEMSTENLEKDKALASKTIKKLRDDLICDFKSQANQIDKFVIKPLWKEWNKIFCEHFANVNYGYSQSIHSSQGSNFYNAFIDTEDVLKNNNSYEAKRCIYTGITRASNEVHILI
jgi:ATP-dependent exoDNAse (exonuclease V) alpha subunit